MDANAFLCHLFLTPVASVAPTTTTVDCLVQNQVRCHGILLSTNHDVHHQ